MNSIKVTYNNKLDVMDQWSKSTLAEKKTFDSRLVSPHEAALEWIKSLSTEHKKHVICLLTIDTAYMRKKISNLEKRLRLIKRDLSRQIKSHIDAVVDKY